MSRIGKKPIALPTGVTATVDADARTLTIDEAALAVEARTTEGAAEAAPLNR